MSEYEQRDYLVHMHQHYIACGYLDSDAWDLAYDALEDRLEAEWL